MAPVGYAQIIDKFWPCGLAWPRDPATLQGKLRRALAPECERLEQRIPDLLNEADPRMTIELLLDFERALGLPDNCGAPPVSLEQRRQAVITRLSAMGGQNKAYFIQLAATYGFTIAIEEYLPFDCQGDCDGQLFDESWAYTFKVIAPALTVRQMTCDSFCDEYLTTWGNKILECLMNRYKPAHLAVLFEYV